MKTNFKSLIFVSCCLLLVAIPKSAVFGAPTTTNTPSPTIDTRQKDLIERVASREAELREKRKKGVLGTVVSVKDSTIIFKTNSGNKTITVDELTEYLWINKDKTKLTIKLSNVEVGDEIVAVGVQNTDGTITARIIIGRLYPKTFIGTITKLDKTTLEIKSGEDVYSFTFGSSVKYFSLTNDKITENTLGLKVGQKVLVKAISKTNDKKTFEAYRVLVLP